MLIHSRYFKLQINLLLIQIIKCDACLLLIHLVISDYLQKYSLDRKNKYQLVQGRWVATFGNDTHKANKIIIKKLAHLFIMLLYTLKLQLR
jgi:hypothetical protein